MAQVVRCHHPGLGSPVGGNAVTAPARERTTVVQLAGAERGSGVTNKLASPSPQSGNLRIGPQLPLHIVTAGPEDDASGATGLELGETFAQLLASACEGHLFGGGYVDERVMAVRNVE